MDKNVHIPAGATIGVDPELDRARGFTVTDSGLTVLSKDERVLLTARTDTRATHKTAGL